ncbi:hypothetical protein RHSIM_Rhsim10G0160300 [Rhododendron simsii]|uniref:Major facilitator superfamily (MFS) profile domain-containing protein n=1 Tax=Rhododendron simsii TaxID=118357 RepID=A0A834G9W1_RHOSS|nr:hypothetical protein RHSIM_Rhsim10G0160300 [Rhododendron simsii]
MKMGIKKSETLTLILVNLAGIMERADESLLPGVYKEVGATLHTDPTGLGSLTLFRSIVQTFCYPLAAYLATRHNRAHVIALGAFLWAAATFLVAISSTYVEVAVSRGLNGIGLAIVIPSVQSLVADSTDETNRGTAFGWLQFTGNIGSIIGGLLSVLLASTSFMGIAGWRIAFHLVALISVVVGVLVHLFAHDPRFDEAKAQIPQKPFWTEVKDLITEAKSVIKIPSFQIIVGQGVAGSFPWNALSFCPMWLELVGFSHKKVAFLWTLFIIAGSLGSIFGGKMGDILGQRYPNSGRIVLSQISSSSGIPLAAVLLLVLPYDPSTAFMHGFVLFSMGLVMTWCAPATNNPIFAEIVPVKSRTSIYALDQSFETVLAAFAPPIVGLLAQRVFGYKPIRNGSTSSEEIETDRKNAASLAKALYAAIGIPFTICFLIYSLLHCTYPRDRDRARMQTLIESEMQQMEDSPSIEEYSWIHALGGNEGSVSEVDYEEGDESLDFDKNDEKRLIPHEIPNSSK